MKSVILSKGEEDVGFCVSWHLPFFVCQGFFMMNIVANKFQCYNKFHWIGESVILVKVHIGFIDLFKFQ